MKIRTLALLLTLILAIQVLTPTAAAADRDTCVATQQEITDAILALRAEYPEGMLWTNGSPDKAYTWTFPGSIVAMSGCVALTAIFQDRVFGSNADKPITWQRISQDCSIRGLQECAVPYAWETLWPGDILCFDGHAVLVLQKFDDHISVVEGNYNGIVHWGRTITKEGVETAKYVWTRYNKTEPFMPFSDLPEPGHWSRPAVTWAILNDVAAPVSATRFGLKEQCTRADVVSFFWAAAGRPEPTDDATGKHFTDVSEDADYYKAVRWAVEQGIVYGLSKTSFSPDALCNRGQALTFLWRAAGCPDARSCSGVFTDVLERKFYFPSVSWAVDEGITRGTSSTTFSPDRTVNRAEVLTFLYLLYGT